MLHRSMSAWMFCWFTSLLVATSLHAQEPDSPRFSSLAALTASPDSALNVALADLPGESLLLSEAVNLAARQATATRMAAAQLTAASQAVRREQGVFDPELFGSADWSGADTPSASPFAGAEVLETTRSSYEAGARMRLPLGTELSASLNSLRLGSNSAFAALEPEYQAFGALTMRQPLLKGFGPSARGDLRFAQRSRDAASARYQGALLAVRSEVESTYWELHAAERNHAVSLIIRDRAVAFLRDTQLRASAGIIGPSQVANAEFFLTETEHALLDTEEQLDRFSDRLASLMGRRPHELRYRAGDEPPRVFPVADQDSLVAVTMRRNPELLALSREADALRALTSGAMWDARPTLDLVGGLGGNGLAGVPRDVTSIGGLEPTAIAVDPKRGDSISDVLNRNHPTWNVGFVFALPLGNREGKGERDRFRAEVVRAEQRLLAAERAFEEEVRAQYRELTRGARRMELATRGVSASIKQVEIGLLEYRNGRSTAFEVVRLAADLATAQQRYSAALVRTAPAAAILRQLTGGWYSGTLTVTNSGYGENGS